MEVSISSQKVVSGCLVLISVPVTNRRDSSVAPASVELVLPAPPFSPATFWVIWPELTRVWDAPERTKFR